MALKRILGLTLVAFALGLMAAPAVHAAPGDLSDPAFVDEVPTYDPSLYDTSDVSGVLDQVVPTNPQVQPVCPEGTAPLLYNGAPVVTDAAGTPVCVTPQANGQPGETVPGQNGESGYASDSEGVVDPGSAGEVVNPSAL